VSDLTEHNTIVVNPECITKGPTAGTYALVSVHPLKEEELIPVKSEEATHGRVYDHLMRSRTRVDVIRI
jgi:hypothetical protein